MARTKMTPRKTIAPIITPQEFARRFRTFTYSRDWKATFGEFLAKFFALWEDAKDYVTDYEACECLVNQVPAGWRLWAETQMVELVFTDSITGALRCHFPNLLRRLFDQWIIYGNPPKAAVLSGGVSHAELSEPVCSDRNNVSALQPPYSELEAGPSTKSVLRRELSSDDVVEVPRTRELARKGTHDSPGCHVDVRACGKRAQHVLLIEEEEDPVEE